MLVSSWLSEIGLEYAVPTFDAAGIDSPEALAQLQVNHFEALGVASSEDRRKLFFLVQRIKQSLVESQKNGKQAQEGTTTATAAAASSDATEPSKSTAPTSSASPSSTAATSVSEKISKENDYQQPRKAGAATTTTTSLPSPPKTLQEQQPQQRTTLGVTVNQTVEADHSSSSHEEWHETAEIIEESMQPAFNSNNNRRTSGIAKPTRTSRLSVQPPPAAPPAPRNTSRLSMTATETVDSNKDHRRRGSTSLSNSTSTSGRPLPSRSTGTTTTSQPGRSLRTGKPLSVIPAHATAPMSPLVDLVAIATAETGELPPSNRSRSNTDDTSNSDTEKRRRLSTTTNNNNPRRLSQHAQSFTIDTTVSSPKRNTARRTHSDVGRTSRNNNNHKIDDSFKAQIARLRDATNADYEFGIAAAAARSHDGVLVQDMRIRVVVRKRPMSRNEIAAATGDVDVIHPLEYGSYGKILVYQPRTKVDLTKEIETISFAFDNTFDEHSSNIDVYERSVRHLIPNLLDGEWVSIFAYGQTGSGKTYTMMGAGMTTGCEDNDNDVNSLGLYYMAALDLFHILPDDLSVSVSLFEIYGGKLFDLLNDRAPVKCLENSKGQICFPGLSKHAVDHAKALLERMQVGATQRSTGTTSRNANSSRSHAVLQLHIQRGAKEYSRLTFIDLAGSERGADTSTACRATRMEGAEINTSLLALKEVIRALATDGTLTHVPFRGSKLTQVLKESFVGSNCHSVMIACISPNIGNCEQTLNTLRYADRVKERNAETGQLANEPPPETNAASLATLLPSQSNGQSGSSQNLDEVSNASSLLDDILASPPPKGGSPEVSREEEDGESARVAGEALLSAHKEAMSAMLSMVKDEMAIVNSADSGRDGLDEYISQVMDIQERQLSYIVDLREKLIEFYVASGGVSAEPRHDSDDSFEDLRS